MGVRRMDNVLIVVEDLEGVKDFFVELGLRVEGETVVEGPEVGGLIGLKDVRATLVMLRTADGQGIELDKFHTPAAVRVGPVELPVNALGLRRVMFGVEGMEEVLARMVVYGAKVIGEMRYGEAYRLAYVRGPEGIVVGLAEEMGKGGRGVRGKGCGQRGGCEPRLGVVKRLPARVACAKEGRSAINESKTGYAGQLKAYDGDAHRTGR